VRDEVWTCLRGTQGPAAGLTPHLEGGRGRKITNSYVSVVRPAPYFWKSPLYLKDAVRAGEEQQREGDRSGQSQQTVTLQTPVFVIATQAHLSLCVLSTAASIHNWGAELL